MTRRGARVGQALRVLGFALVLVAVVEGRWWALAAALGARLAAAGLVLSPLVRSRVRTGGRAQPSDFPHILDVVRRAHGGLAAWAVGLEHGEIEGAGAARGGGGGGGEAAGAQAPRGARGGRPASRAGRAHRRPR